MDRIQMWVGACAMVALVSGAAPPPRLCEDPEPPKAVYHNYRVILNGKKRSPDDLRKLFAPLALALCEEMSDDEFAERTAREGREWREYRVWIRTRDRYEKVQDVIKGKPGVHRVWAPPAHVAKKTVDRLPVPIFRDSKAQPLGFVPVPKN